MAQAKRNSDGVVAKTSSDGTAKDPGQRVRGSQIFIGGLARTVTENMIRELFSSCGEIVDINMKIDQDGNSKGYCFLRFSTKEAASRAHREKNGFKLLGKKIRVAPSQEQDSLFLGGLRKDWTSEEFEKMVRQAFQDVVSVDLSRPPFNANSATERKQNNRGFGFVQFSSHGAAARAHRLASKPNFVLDGNWHPVVDWVENEPEIDPEELAQVKVAFVGNLPTNVDEEFLKKIFKSFGKIERAALSRKSHFPVGFVHFSKRSELEKAIEEMDGKMVEGPDKDSRFKIQVSIAKPVDKDRKRHRDEPESKPTKNTGGRDASVRENYNFESFDVHKSKVPRIKTLEGGSIDPYEEALITLPPAVEDCLRRIFRTGVITRDDIDIHLINRLRDLPPPAAIAALDELMLTSGRFDKGRQLAILIERYQVNDAHLSHERVHIGNRAADFGRGESDIRSLSGLSHAPSFDAYNSRPVGATAITRYDRYTPSPSRLRSYSTSVLDNPLSVAKAGAKRAETGSYSLYHAPGPSVYSSGVDDKDTVAERRRLRFDPFTGQPYKFDPFTGEPLEADAIPGQRSRF